jgi:hypothetical protein
VVDIALGFCFKRFWQVADLLKFSFAPGLPLL